MHHATGAQRAHVLGQPSHAAIKPLDGQIAAFPQPEMHARMPHAHPPTRNRPSGFALHLGPAPAFDLHRKKLFKTKKDRSFQGKP